MDAKLVEFVREELPYLRRLLAQGRTDEVSPSSIPSYLRVQAHNAEQVGLLGCAKALRLAAEVEGPARSYILHAWGCGVGDFDVVYAAENEGGE